MFCTQMSYYVYVIEKFQTYIIKKHIVVNVHTRGTHTNYFIIQNHHLLKDKDNKKLKELLP
jgi:hypothetical protein